MGAKRTASPEFRLVAACCRWPPSPERDAAVRAAAAEVEDWPHFETLLKRHRVWGLAHAALTDAAVRLPPEMASALSARSARLARANLSIVAESLRLVRLFEGQGIAVRVFKGVELAARAYGTQVLKHSADIDLLVAPEALDQALSLLECQGYCLEAPLSQRQRAALLTVGNELTLTNPVLGTAVDLHWRLTRIPLRLPCIGIASAVEEVPVTPSHRLPSFPRDDLATYLSVHGAIACWFRLKWLADFNALLASEAPEELERLYRHAQKRGIGASVGLALLLSQRLLGRELSEPLARELRGSWRLARLVDLSLDQMLGPDETAEQRDRFLGGQLQILAVALLSRLDPAYLATSLWFACVAPLDAIRLPLPRLLRPLYPLFGPPMWLQRRFAFRRRER